MNYAIMIAAVFILATIAVAVLSPFDHLPQRSPRETAAAAQVGDGSSSSEQPYSDSDSRDDGSYNESHDDTSSDGREAHWPEGEEPPE
jgi:hypothetical protein